MVFRFVELSLYYIIYNCCIVVRLWNTYLFDVYLYYTNTYIVTVGVVYIQSVFLSAP